jgi:hypothetical protein
MEKMMNTGTLFHSSMLLLFLAIFVDADMKSTSMQLKLIGGFSWRRVALSIEEERERVQG